MALASLAVSLLATILLVSLVSAAPPDCTNEIAQLQPCLSYVSGQVSVPSGDCCKGLEAVHVNRPVCLCEVMQSSGSAVNSSAATMLPSICKVQTDPKRCPELLKGADGPSSASSSTSPRTVSGGGDKAGPSSSASLVAGTSLVAALPSLFLYFW